MTLGRLLDAVARRRKSLVLYAPSEVELADRFGMRNVDVTFRELPSGGPDPFVTVTVDGEFRGAFSVASLQSFHWRRQLNAVRDENEPDRLSLAEFEVLCETLFDSLDRAQLLAASRVIESAAWRAGSGTFQVGFQSLSAFRTQRTVYERLAVETDLDVHAYIGDDRALTALTDRFVTIHTEPRAEIDRYWFLVYDGDGNNDEKRALVAEQADAETYRGAWTTDPALADDAADALR